MASAAFRRVERYRDHAAHVDSDYRQDSTDAKSMDEPLLARHPLRHLTRPNDFTDPAQFAHVRDTV